MEEFVTSDNVHFYHRNSSPYNKARRIEEQKRKRVMKLIKQQQKRTKQKELEEQKNKEDQESKIQKRFQSLEAAYKRNQEQFKKQQQLSGRGIKPMQKRKSAANIPTSDVIIQQAKYGNPKTKGGSKSARGSKSLTQNLRKYTKNISNIPSSASSSGRGQHPNRLHNNYVQQHHFPPQPQGFHLSPIIPLKQEEEDNPEQEIEAIQTKGIQKGQKKNGHQGYQEDDDEDDDGTSSLQLTQNNVEGFSQTSQHPVLSRLSPPPAYNISEIPTVPRDKITPNFDTFGTANGQEFFANNNSSSQFPKAQTMKLTGIGNIGGSGVGDYDFFQNRDSELTKKNITPLILQSAQMLNSSNNFQMKKKSEDMYRKLKNFAQRFKLQAEHLVQSANFHLSCNIQNQAKQGCDDKQINICDQQDNIVILSDNQGVDSQSSPIEDQKNNEKRVEKGEVEFVNSFIKRKLTDPNQLCKWNQGFVRLSLLILQNSKKTSFNRFKEKTKMSLNELINQRAYNSEPQRLYSHQLETYSRPIGPITRCEQVEQKYPSKKKSAQSEIKLAGLRSRENQLIKSQNSNTLQKSNISTGRWGKEAETLLKQLENPQIQRQFHPQQQKQQEGVQQKSANNRIYKGMRLALGSQASVREESQIAIQRFSSVQQGLNVKYLISSQDRKTPHQTIGGGLNIDVFEKSTDSIFQKSSCTFQQFKHQKFIQLMDPTNMDEFVKDIENKLNEKADQKAESIDKMFKSVRSSEADYFELDIELDISQKLQKQKIISVNMEIKKTQGNQENREIAYAGLEIRLSSKSIVVEGGNNTSRKEEQKQDPFQASKISSTDPYAAATAIVNQSEAKEDDQVSELIQIQQSSQNQDQVKIYSDQKSNEREQKADNKKQPNQLLECSVNTQEVNSITAIAAIALLDDSSRLAQSGQIKDDMMSSGRGLFSSMNRRNQQALDRQTQYESKDGIPKIGPVQEQQDQQPCKPSFRAINEIRSEQIIIQMNKSNSINTSREECNKNTIDLFGLPQGINYQKKDSAQDSSQQTTFRRINQQISPAAPPYTPQYISQDQSNPANYQRNDMIDSKVSTIPQNTQRESYNLKPGRQSPSISYQLQINENMLLIPDKLKGMHNRTDSDNISQSPGALVSAANQPPQSQQVKDQQQIKQQIKDNNQSQEKKSRNSSAIIEICYTDSINSNQSDLQSDYQKISDLVAAQLMQIYIEDTIQCCIFKILGLDLQQNMNNDQSQSNANAIFENMRQPNNAEIFERIRGGVDQQQSKYKGIKTDVDLVKNYITRIKQNIGQNKDSLVQNLSTPLFRDPLVTLAHLQNYQYRADDVKQQEKQEGHNSQSNQDSQQPQKQQEEEQDQRGGAADIIMAQQSVLHIDLYLDIERRRKDQHLLDWADDDRKERDQSKKEQKSDKQEKTQQKGKQDGKENDQDQAQFFARQWENIHNKAIFDALNQAFDSFRPFGLRGPPLPWSKKLRALKQTKIDKNHFSNVFNQVVSWASTRAGAIKLRIPQDLDCQDDIEQNIQRFQLFTRQQEQQRLKQVWQQKLAVMLAEQVDENQSLWLDYEYQETQVMLDLTDMILQQLGGETVHILQSIEEKKRKRKQEQEKEENKVI